MDGQSPRLFAIARSNIDLDISALGTESAHRHNEREIDLKLTSDVREVPCRIIATNFVQYTLHPFNPAFMPYVELG